MPVAVLLGLSGSEISALVDVEAVLDQIAVLRFNELAARWVAEEEWHPGVNSEPQEDGGVILRIPYKHNTELVMDILRHGANVEVLGPVSLRRTVAQAHADAARQY